MSNKSGTWTAKQLIALSRKEHRTVTEYPDNETGFASLCEYLSRRSCETVSVSGEGYCGCEARGWVRYIGKQWIVDIVRPE
jgi:hypothetical protein